MVLRVPVAVPAAGTAATVAMLKLLQQKQVLAVLVLPQQLLAARDRLVAYRHFFFLPIASKSSDTVLIYYLYKISACILLISHDIQDSLSVPYKSKQSC